MFSEMDFVTPIITPIVESLMVPVKKHLGFLVSSTKHVKEMGERMEQLNVTAKDIQEKEEVTAAKSQIVPREASKWLKDVKNLNEEAQSITPTAAIGCLNVATRYKAGKRSCDILKKIDDLKTRKSEIEWTNDQIPLGMVTGSTFVPAHDGDGTHNNFGSRDLIFKAALKSLQPDSETQKMIALCGMGGVGKTTMMEQLKKAVKDSKTFDWVVKVVLGEDTNPIMIQQAIAERLGGSLTETDVDARADRLHKMFEGISQNGKRKILVIMDDLWKVVKLKEFGLRSPLPNGFKLLFTSRFENVCTQMGVDTESILNVGVLNDAEAKMLFFETVGKDGDDPQLHKIGEDIAKKCGGLPIAIKTIASILRGEIKDAWEAAIYRLEEHDLEDLRDIVPKIFEMSYQSLKKDLDKAIFLLSGLFPDDHDIPIEDLLRYGSGLGFFKNVKNFAIARRDMKISVSNLIRANLLTESDRKGCVKMHDLTRDFVLSNFSKVKQASILNHDNMPVQRLTEDGNCSYERILIKCEGMSQFPVDFDYPDLSLIMLMDGHKGLKFRKDFFAGMRKLEVVSYERMHTPFLPVMFECPTKLRTLCFRSCSLMDDYSFLGSLENLETLSFADCKIRKLPSTIGQLKWLKLLDVRGCIDLSIDDGVFKNLVSLEDLYMKVFEDNVVRFTDANCEELKILSRGLSTLELEFFDNKAYKNVSFKQLKMFRISIGSELEYLEDYSFRNTLILVAKCNELRECKISGLFEKTEELYLQVNDMNRIEDVSTMHLSQNSFCYLRTLVISQCLELTYLFTIHVANGLKKLKHLKISECPKLVSLCDAADNVVELPQMVELVLHGLPNFSSIYPDSNNAYAIQSFLNTQVAIPKLERLDISMMENLKQIWPCEITTSNDKSIVSMLREIRVRKCDSLENLFPSNPLPLLCHLEELKVEECGSIEVLFNIDMERVCEIEKENRSNRLRKIKVKGLEKLRELWRMRGLIANSHILINSFKGVEMIEIENCKRFTNIFTPNTTNFDLGALTVYISRSTGHNSEEWAGKNKLVECSEETSVMFEREISSSTDENITNVAYTSHLMHTCHNLQHLELVNDPRVEVVFEMDTPSRKELASFQDTQPPPHLLLTHQLMFLNLDSLKEMSHVWKCNWNKFSIPHPLEFPFHNLTHIYLGKSDKIKYLFSPLMAKFLSNLKGIEIQDCNGMEEVISSRDDEMLATSTSSHTTNTTYFPHLDYLTLVDLTCLKRIDDEIKGGHAEVISVSNWSLCQYPKWIHIGGCSALSSVIPWYAVEQMKKLENLNIKLCSSITEVFESEASASSCTLLTRLHHVPQLSNLKHLTIYGCDLLRHVFTFSTLESLKQLKKLFVGQCKVTQVIVREEEIVNENALSSSSKGVGSVVVEFTRVELLILEDLPNLEGFFLGNNNINFRWPLLNFLKIAGCPRMSGFTSGESKTPNLNYIHTGLGKHRLDEYGLNSHGSTGVTNLLHDHHQTTLSLSADPTISKWMPWSFHNLIELYVFNTNVETVIPSNVLLQLQKLERVHTTHSHKVREIFEVCWTKGESKTAMKIPNLTEVKLQVLDGLKYIWKSNQWMVLEFPNLTTVSIEQCDKLEHVFTCSMAGSLVQLQYLSIRNCNNIEVIIKEDEVEEEEEGRDAKVNEILLPRLKSIKLGRLPRLKGLCLGKKAFSLSLLDTLEIKGCLAITVFTEGHLDTPELKLIDTSFGMFYITHNLNSFIRTHQEEGMFGTFYGVI